MKSFVAVAILVLAFVPAFTSAQDADLRATIGGALLQDPAAAALPQAEFEALLDAMVADAEARGVTVEDISYVPPASQDFSPQAVQAAAEDWGSTLTALEKTLLALGALFLVFLVLWLLYRWLHEDPVSLAPPMNQGMPRQY